MHVWCDMRRACGCMAGAVLSAAAFHARSLRGTDNLLKRQLHGFCTKLLSLAQQQGENTMVYLALAPFCHAHPGAEKHKCSTLANRAVDRTPISPQGLAHDCRR